MPRVLNIRTASAADLRNAIRIDRTTRWGNPHRIGGYCLQCRKTHHDRAEVIEAYKTGLRYNALLVKSIREQCAGRDVACWCAPLPCHGEPFIEVANGNPEWLRK